LVVRQGVHKNIWRFRQTISSDRGRRGPPRARTERFGGLARR